MKDVKLYFEEYGERLLKARGMTKARFARLMGVHRQNVHYLFATKDIENLRKAARVLDVPFELLISYAEDPLKDCERACSEFPFPEYIRIILPYAGFEKFFKVECMGEVIEDPDEVRCLAMFDQESDQFDFTVNLKTKRLTKWIYEVDFRIRANMQDRGTYILMDKDMAPIMRMSGGVPKGLIPGNGEGDPVDIVIDEQGVITNWPAETDYSMFSSEGTVPDDVGIGKWGVAIRLLYSIYDANLSDSQLNWIAENIRR